MSCKIQVWESPPSRDLTDKQPTRRLSGPKLARSLDFHRPQPNPTSPTPPLPTSGGIGTPSNLSPGNSAGKSSTSLCKRREHMGRRWQSGLCRIPTRTLFPLGINLLARGGPTSPVTKTGTSGSLIFLILPFSSIGASWWRQPDAATTEILISTAWTYLPSVIGVKAGVRTCPPSPIRRL